MPGRASRRKGHNFERAMARELRALWPGAKRGYQREGEDQRPDVDGTPYWIECKRGKRTSIPAAMRQAEKASDGRPPVAICKDDQKQATVTMRLEDWICLLTGKL
jgi:hypothetical protein